MIASQCAHCGTAIKVASDIINIEELDKMVDRAVDSLGELREHLQNILSGEKIPF